MHVSYAGVVRTQRHLGSVPQPPCQVSAPPQQRSPPRMSMKTVRLGHTNKRERNVQAHGEVHPGAPTVETPGDTAAGGCWFLPVKFESQLLVHWCLRTCCHLHLHHHHHHRWCSSSCRRHPHRPRCSSSSSWFRWCSSSPSYSWCYPHSSSRPCPRRPLRSNRPRERRLRKSRPRPRGRCTRKRGSRAGERVETRVNATWALRIQG